MRVCPQCKAIFVSTTAHCGIDGAKLEIRDSDPLIGTTVDRYRFDAALGSGGMGNVYRATHVELEREVAVKVLWGDLSANPDFVARFRREARAMSKIQHENITSVRDFMVLDTGLSLLVMEYVPGRTLKEYLTDIGPLKAPEAARIAKQIAEGLGEAHRLGFVHRDLKPANIILTEVRGEEVVKILDFGNVRVIDEEKPGAARLTQVGLIVGTPIYMAPEQVEQNAGPSADLYALGIILYEMLSGAPPFNAGALTELLALHVHRPPEPLPNHGGLERVAHHLLGKTPDQRPASAEAVVAAIDGCFQTDEPSLPGPAAPTADRLWQIAANRLRALGLTVYFAEGAIRGALAIDPSRFGSVDGAGIGSDVLSFVALTHDTIGFVAPVAARSLGSFPIFEVADQAQLVAGIEARWAQLANATQTTLDRARAFVRTASVRPETWTVESAVADQLGMLSFRFDPSCTQLALVAVGADVLTPEESRAIPAIALPEQPDGFDFVEASAPLIERARTMFDVRPRGEETVHLLTHIGPDDADEEAGERLGLDAPIQLRLPRIPCNVSATMSWGGRTEAVTIANVNAHGVFVAIPEDAAPDIDEVVELRGFGNIEISARVRHRRPAEEANVLGSKEGVGLAFREVEADSRDAMPAALVVLEEGPVRNRAHSAISSYGCRPILVDNLAAVAAAMHLQNIRLILMDGAIDHVGWHGVVAALDLRASDVPFVIVGENVTGPIWAEVVRGADLDDRFVQSKL